MEFNGGVAVRVCEPGRSPLQLVLHSSTEIGRDCNGLLLTDVLLSRRHLRVSSVGNCLTVEDLGSTNGTSIDGTRVSRPTIVCPGQVVTFGQCHLEVVTTGPPDDLTAGMDAFHRSSIDIVATAAAAEPLPPKVLGSETLTIVFSDIEQSTRRALELGDKEWMRLLGAHNAMVRRQVERSGGFEVKAQGDGFMLAFPSARAAILCSIEVMRTLEAHSRSKPTDALRIRIGMHTGEAIEDGGDLFGKPVVLAARIANEARGGEILVSSLVREIVESRGDVAFGEAREVKLKGLPTRYLLHTVDWARRD
jgi:class 3 adenylate cyclase